MFRRLLLGITLFALPFQLSKYFWLEGSSIAGLRLDLLAFRITFTDLLVLACLITFLVKNSLPSKLTISLFILFLTSLSASPTLLTLLQTAKFVCYVFFSYSLTQIPKVTSLFLNALKFQIPLLLGLTIYQLYAQHSVNGIFYYLGERFFDTATLNLARIYNFIRPMSTFSHPNSLAGYSLIIYFYLHSTNKLPLVRFLTLALIVLTFSKAALLGLIIYHLIRSANKTLIIFSTLVTFLLIAYTWPSSSIEYRLTQYQNLKIPTFTQLLTGVGYQNSIHFSSQNLPSTQLNYQNLQPIHNTILLYLVEFGLVGFILIYLNKHYCYELTRKHLPITIGLLPTLLFDHYWWTLSQNQLIMLTIIAILSYEKFSSHHHPLRWRF